MKNWFRINKWLINWTILLLMVTVFVLLLVFFQDKRWLSNVLQVQGAVIGFYITLLVFINSNESSDKQFREHVDKLQELNAEQIRTLNEITNVQIQALQESTQRQIESFERQIAVVTDKLADNSVLLAEILARELEKSIQDVNNSLIEEQHKYSDLSKWKLLRDPADREKQLTHQWSRIQQIKKGLEYLISKYKQVKSFLTKKIP